MPEKKQSVQFFMHDQPGILSNVDNIFTLFLSQRECFPWRCELALRANLKLISHPLLREKPSNAHFGEEMYSSFNSWRTYFKLSTLSWLFRSVHTVIYKLYCSSFSYKSWLFTEYLLNVKYFAIQTFGEVVSRWWAIYSYLSLYRQIYRCFHYKQILNLRYPRVRLFSFSKIAIRKYLRTYFFYMNHRTLFLSWVGIEFTAVFSKSWTLVLSNYFCPTFCNYTVIKGYVKVDLSFVLSIKKHRYLAWGGCGFSDLRIFYIVNWCHLTKYNVSFGSVHNTPVHTCKYYNNYCNKCNIFF